MSPDQAGRRPYTQLNIERFRSIRSLTLDRLGQINVLIGSNGSGKTSALEGLWLHCAGPNAEAVIRTLSFRGLPPLDIHALRAFASSPPALAMSDFAQSIFNVNSKNGDVSESLKSVISDGKREIAIHLVSQYGYVTTMEPATKEVVPPAGIQIQIGPPHIGSQPIPLFQLKVVERTVGEDQASPGSASESSATFFATNIQYTNIPSRPRHSAIYFNDLTTYHWEQAALWFDAAMKRHRHKYIIEMAAKIDRRIKEVWLSMFMGRPTLALGVGEGSDQNAGHRPYVMLPFGGSGARRIVELAAALFGGDAQILLIDEIENGMYYQAMPDMWRFLMRAATEYNMQVFVSTHSLECLGAAADVLQEDEFNDLDFVVYRLERRGRAEPTRAVRIEKDALKAAIDLNLEIR